MSSPEFTTDKVCFVDPATDHVRTYAQFAEDVACPPVGDDVDSAYESICLIVSQIIRGDDVDIAQVRFETNERNLELGKGSANRAVDFSLTSSVPGASARPLTALDESSVRGAGVRGAGARPLTSLDESSVPGAGARPLTVDWLQKIRDSESQIQLKTSGTTGQPKLVVHSVQSLTRGVRTGAHHQNDVWGLAYPLDHLAGLQVLFQALFNQNAIVQLFGLPFDVVHRTIERRRITHLSCTPTFLKLLASNARAHPHVQRLTTGGERCDPATLASVKQLFPAARHRNIYALTEVGNLLVADGDQFIVPAELLGKVKVINGNLAIHRSLLADLSAAASKGLADNKPASHEDYYLTGDLVDILSENPLTFKFAARRDDVINVGGYKVIPQQVEECLVNFPSIQQAMVYGKKNSVTGQIVVCDLVLEPDSRFDAMATKQELVKVLPNYAVPRIMNVVDSLRMTQTGKLCRRDATS